MEGWEGGGGIYFILSYLSIWWVFVVVVIVLDGKMGWSVRYCVLGMCD